MYTSSLWTWLIQTLYILEEGNYMQHFPIIRPIISGGLENSSVMIVEKYRLWGNWEVE